MIADYFSKPIQGKAFHEFRDLILRIWAEDYNAYKKQFYAIFNKHDLCEYTSIGSSDCTDTKTSNDSKTKEKLVAFSSCQYSQQKTKHPAH